MEEANERTQRIHYRALPVGGKGMAKSANGSFPVGGDLYAAWMEFRRDAVHHPYREEVQAFMSGYQLGERDEAKRGNPAYGKGRFDGRNEVMNECAAILANVGIVAEDYPSLADALTAAMDLATAPREAAPPWETPNLVGIALDDLLGEVKRRLCTAEARVQKAERDAARFDKLRALLADAG